MQNQPLPKPKLAGFELLWKSYNFLAFNTSVPEGFELPDDADKFDALMFFHWDGSMWNFTLKQSPNLLINVDLAHLAKAFPGGGGEKGNATFRTAQIPFPLYAHP